jgi:hypothetical protein
MKKYYYVISAIVVVVVLFGVYQAVKYVRNRGDNNAFQIETIKGEDSNGNTEHNSAGLKEDGNNSYYLLLSDNKITIYKGIDKKFYDYADVDLATMPIEVREQLKYGLYITTEEELYDFLQTYSS